MLGVLSFGSPDVEVKGQYRAREEMVKQTIQIFARVKPTARKQQQGVRVRAVRAPARRGLPGLQRGGTRGVWARGRGSNAAGKLAKCVCEAPKPPALCRQGRGQTDAQARPPSTAPRAQTFPALSHIHAPGHTHSRRGRCMHVCLYTHITAPPLRTLIAPFLQTATQLFTNIYILSNLCFAHSGETCKPKMRVPTTCLRCCR